MMLEVRGLLKSFGSGGEKINVLRGVDLSLGKGEIAALMGPSGVGKSTLLHLVAGLEPPDSGEIAVDGRDLSSLSGDDLDTFRNRTIGIVYQHHYLLPEFTAFENVFLPTLKSAWTAASKRKALDLLEAVGLGERLNHFPSQLSGGEQQRVSLARALVMSPRLVLADEPTGDLDEATSDSVFDLIFSLARNREITLLMATHNLRLAEKCDRIMKLHGGRIE